MDDRPNVWDEANRRHLGEDHPERHISIDEIDQVLTDAERIEIYLARRRAYQVVGRTSVGRWLVVILDRSARGAIPDSCA